MVDLVKPRSKPHSLLVKCLLASVGIHIAGVIFFYQNPVLLRIPFPSLFKSSSSPQLLSSDSKELALEEALNQLITLPPMSERPYDLPSVSVDRHYKAFREDVTVPTMPLNQELNTPAVNPILHTATPEFSFPSERATSLATPEKLDLPRSSPAFTGLRSHAVAIPEISTTLPQQDDELVHNVPPACASGEAISLPSCSIAAEEIPSIEAPIRLSGVAPEIQEQVVSQMSSDLIASCEAITPLAEAPLAATTSLPQLESYALPTKASVLEWSDSFDVETQVMPHPEGKGYLFSVTLLPKKEFQASRMQQNVYFLIDRSNSVEKHRYTNFKRAVMKALPCLQEGDQFNIYIFDNKVSTLGKSLLPFSKKSLEEAQQFLEKEGPGGLFSATDVYTSFQKSLPSSTPENVVNTAILLSDGNTLLSAKEQKKVINQWLSRNQRQFSLYAATAGENNNLLLLDLISSVNGGELLHADTLASFPRKLGKLLLTLRNPIAKDLSATAIALNSHAKITLYPASSQMAPLYSGKAYTLLGQTDQLTDFSLLIQGHHQDLWLNIQKTISLKESKETLRPLEKLWATEESRLHYQNFLQDGKTAHLDKAQEALKR